METKYQAVSFSGEEYIKAIGIAQSFLDKGKIEENPEFVFVLGIVGAGKTTTRKNDFSDGFVNFEFGEILSQTRKIIGDSDQKIDAYLSLVPTLILHEALEKKYNIVTEIIGDNHEVITAISDKVKEKGYQVSVQFVHCEPMEAYKRHLAATKSDSSYFSSAFTQEFTISFLYTELGLGEMPEIATP
jgi:hypothetical protein